MSNNWRVFGWVVLALACFIAAAATLRIEPQMLWVVLVVGLFFRSFRSKPLAVGGVVLVAALSALSPIGLTFTNFPGPPHLTQCCPGIPARWKEAVAAQQAGQCLVCSDVVSGFEPRSYLVW